MSTVNSGHSDDDSAFDQAFKPLNNTDLYLNTLDKLTVSEKQSMQTKS